MFEQAQTELCTVRDMMRFAVSRFTEAGLFFGHGSDNAWDESAYLLLHTLNLPLDRLEPFMDARLTSDERALVLKIIRRRISERLPAAYLTNEAWLGEHRFYVDRRVIVLYATFATAADERRYELAVMRALGARRDQLRRALLAEFAAVGGLAGLIAAIGAIIVGQVLANRVLNFEVEINYWLPPLAVLAGAALVTGAGWFAAVRLMRAPPLEALRAGG